ncbi:MAG: hypothetical protein SFV54_09430 [Bryobacteraceae bacterium]|nr:hypothetical protein [Bryobacteraceae bacterium]
MTVYELFQSALRREPPPDLPHVVDDGEQHRAAFDLTFEHGRIVRAQYRASTCVTLVALCEELSRIAVGLTRAQALGLNANSLLLLHPEIPPARQARAALAVRAFEAALLETTL